MIEVIKRGTKKICTCSECGCSFKYEEEDVNVGVFNAVDTIQCPQCNVNLVVKYYSKGEDYETLPISN